MKLGGIWVGIPFLIATGFFVLALWAISLASTNCKEDRANGVGPRADEDEESFGIEDASLALA